MNIQNLISTKKSSHKYTFLSLFLLVILLVNINDVLPTYQQPIGEIISIDEAGVPDTELSPFLDYKQILTLKLINEELSTQPIKLENEFSYSQAFSNRYEVGQLLILRKTTVGTKNEYDIVSLKRDTYMVSLLIIFAFLAVLIGGKQGAKSLVSVLLNFAIVFVIMYLYRNNVSIYLLAPIAVIIFIFTSMTLVTGFNKKTLAASLGTALGLLFAITIAYVTFKLTGSRGVNYQEMDITISSPVELFYFQLVIGTLGAIMDIAVSIASSIEEILKTSTVVTRKMLISSGRKIGNDIMGTMTNTLILAYLSGSIPVILLMMKSGISLGYMMNISLSLELLRGVIGSIGIVLSIPITLLISIVLLDKVPHSEVK
ncbi:YibE/F family protein [Fusibacter bizertensis]|uniref:YibE/F family protein n=1 Tax=Fusibacter bizertensis TaxID=1488331 RepID=A0ABT6NGK1_9FIRM|nr:YibE/F family protein [Fusibacter bizertensis]MDH8679483.1 YibE/F family protein [Fusibacter bizertensis]